jgi:hypothetical protein
MKVVIDSAIPYISGVLEPYAEVVYRAGDEFSAEDVKDADALIADDDVSELQWIAIDRLRSEEFGLASIRKGIERLKEIKNTL